MEDTISVLIASIILYIIRRVLVDGFVTQIVLRYGSTEEALKQSPKQKARVKENAWFTLYYILASICGYLILQHTPWLWDLREIVLGYPETHTGHEIPYMRLYLLVGCGFYVQALFTLLFIDEKMKDFMEMLVHHLATIALIVWCLVSYYHRIGTLVLLLHDIVDVFLYSAKTLKHMGWIKTCDFLFIAFVVAFLGLRLIYFPIVISKSLFNFNGWDYPGRYYFVRYVSDAIYPIEVSDYGSCVFRYCLSSYWGLTLLMCLLVCLHIFWFSLIMKIAWRKLVANKLDDIREDDVTDHHSLETKKHK